MMDLVNPTTPERPSPRERLLQAADHLFYAEGVYSVGVDRILKESDVARASLYSTYGSKDQLLRAYLHNRSHGWQAAVAEALPTRWDTARERIVGIFEMLTEWFEAPGYHGCPFINASAEAASNLAIQDVRDDHRAWVRALFTGLARDAGARDPEALSAQLVLLYDGSMAGAQLDRSAEPGRAAQSAARTLLDSALG
jgi:AcrR family transcriptional regulator